MTSPAVARPLWRRIVKWLALAGAVVVLLAGGALCFAWFRSDNDCATRRATTPEHPMQAICYCDYGTADVLKLEEIEKPVAGEHQMVVKVFAAAVNPLDWHFVRGTPYFMRMGTGLRKPKVTRLGVDFAGTIESVGPGVTKFKPGDEIFGGMNGAFAEYVRVRDEGAVTLKPANISFAQAAGVPIAAITALQGLRDQGKVQAGTKVLINGASGGVGTFAVQIAKAFGAHVTGVCSGRNVDMVRSLGADEVVDYTRDDFTMGDVKYDVILDNVGNRTIGEIRRVLAPEGRFIVIGGGGPDKGNWIGPMLLPLKTVFMGPFVSQKMGMMMADLNAADLAALGELMQSGKVTPVVDRTFPLSETADAIRYVETGRARGKVIITMP